jgi:hypothetical protein
LKPYDLYFDFLAFHDHGFHFEIDTDRADEAALECIILGPNVVSERKSKTRKRRESGPRRLEL